MGGGRRKADAEIKEETAEGSGATVKAEAAAAAGPTPAETRPVAQAAAAAVTARVATAVRRPGFSSGLQRRGSEWGVPIAPIF